MQGKTLAGQLGADVVQIGAWLLVAVIFLLYQGEPQLRNFLIFEEERHIMRIGSQFTYNSLSVLSIIVLKYY